MKKVTIWSYDVWGNEDDGFDVNNRSCFAREIDLPEDAYNDDEKLVTWLIDIGFLASHCKPSDISLDGDDMRIEIEQSENGLPLGCIEIDQD